MSVLLGFLILLLLQGIGDVMAKAFHLPIPGHVIGMLLLWAWLSLRADHPVPESLERAVSPLLKHLALFFVPLNVGILDYLGIFQQQGWAIGWAMAIGLLVPMLSTAGFLEWWFRRKKSGSAAHVLPEKAA